MSSPDFLTDDLADLERLRRMQDTMESDARLLYAFADMLAVSGDTTFAVAMGMLSKALMFYLGERGHHEQSYQQVIEKLREKAAKARTV